MLSKCYQGIRTRGIELFQSLHSPSIRHWLAATLALLVCGLQSASGDRPHVPHGEQFYAQPVIAESQPGRLVQLALAGHPEMLAAQSEVGRQAGLRLQSTRPPNPGFGYSSSEVGNEGRGGQQGVYVSQQWITAGKRQLADQAGAWRTRAASQRQSQARLRLSRRVQTQYWSMVAARHRIELLEELEGILEDVVRINQALREAAEAARGDELQAKIEVGQVAVAKRQAEADLQARTAALAATVGVDQAFIESVPTDPWPPALDRQWLDGQAPWSDSPELVEAQSIAEALRWELRLAQSQVVSNVDSFASVQHDAVTDNVIVGVQVGMAIPIRDRKTGLVQAARADLSRGQAEYDRRWRALKTRWAEAVGEYSAAVEMVHAIQRELLSLAGERLELARAAHAQGELEYLDLLTAQRSFLSIRQTELEARQRAAIATVALRTLVVDPSP